MNMGRIYKIAGFFWLGLVLTVPAGWADDQNNAVGVPADSKREEVASGASLPSAPALISSNDSTSYHSEAPGLVSSGIKTVGGLFLVLGLIFIVSFLLKRYMPGRFGALSRQRQMHILETLPLGDKRTVHLLEIQKELFLVGSAPGQVTLLEKISADSSPDVETRHPLKPQAPHARGNGQRGTANSIWVNRWGPSADDQTREMIFGSNEPASATFDDLVEAEMNATATPAVCSSQAQLLRLAEIRKSLETQG